MEIRTVGVVGAGQMGSGIAHVAAAAGYSVLLADLESEYLEKARATIAGHLEREVVKGKRPAKERTAALALLMKMVDAGWLGKKTGRGFYEY